MTDALVLDWLTVIGATRGIPRGQFLSEMWRCAARRNGVTGSMREVRSGLRKVGLCRCRRDYFRRPACCVGNLEGLAWAVKNPKPSRSLYFELKFEGCSQMVTRPTGVD